MSGVSYIRFCLVFYRVFQMYSNVLDTVFHKYFIRHSMSILQDILQGIP